MSLKKIQHVSADQNHMATTFALTVACPPREARRAHAVLIDCHALIHRLELELSEFISTSGVARFNASPVGQVHRLSEPFAELLTLSLRLKHQTLGAFDCLAKSKLTGEGIGWDAETCTAWRLNPSAHISFGAVGKGYALDKIRSLLEREGFHNYILSAGGSSQVIAGFHSEGRPWRWGWSWTRDANDKKDLGLSFEHSTGRPVALGVSGTHEKGNHILDPRTQSETPPNARLSALVARSSAAEADALSTALFVLGWEEGLPRMKPKDDADEHTAVAMIDGSGTPHWNGVFQNFWGSVCTFAFVLLTMPSPLFAQEEIDLGADAADAFTPYLFERHSAWVLLPLFTLVLVLLHLRKINRRNRNDR